MSIYKTILILLFLGASACGGDESDPIVDDNNSGAQTDTGADIVDDTPQQPNYTCPNDGEQVCGGFCVNTSFSMEHCGKCDNACTIGQMSCNGSECVCLNGKTMCQGGCFDTDVSNRHCGTCGNACQLGQTCVEGGCIDISDRPEVLGVLQATNAGRGMQQDCGEHGIKPAVGEVQLNDQLMIAAQAHSEDMAANNFMEHTGSDGSSPGDRAARAEYPGGFIGENIARGYRTTDGVVAAWIDSDGHCRNLMNGQFNEIGIGYAVNPTTNEPFWTQLFGRR